MTHLISQHGYTLIYPILMFFALIAGAIGFYLVLMLTIRQLADQEVLSPPEYNEEEVARENNNGTA